MTGTKRETDVFVVGGGPAGLAAAIAARRKGFSVTLADGAEPPIDKPCGEGLMPETLAALHALGVTIPAGKGYFFRGIQFVAGTARVAADFPEGQGIGIRRPILHRLLLCEAEKLGVKFLWKTPVRGIAGNELRLTQGTLATRWIIGADGGTSRVRRWSGLQAVARRTQRSATRRHYRVRPWTEFTEVHWGPRTQTYVTPVSREEVCIVVMAEKAEDTEFARALGDLPELRERLAGGALSSRERGAVIGMCSLRRVSRGNVALVGDASGGVDAITGEGLRLSFDQAKALADAMQANDLGQYEDAHRRLARRPVWMGQVMLQFGKKVWLRDRAMRAMQARPEFFARMLAIHVGRATPGHVIAAGARFSWRFLST